MFLERICTSIFMFKNFHNEKNHDFSDKSECFKKLLEINTAESNGQTAAPTVTHCWII